MQKTAGCSFGLLQVSLSIIIMFSSGNLKARAVTRSN